MRLVLSFNLRDYCRLIYIGLLILSTTPVYGQPNFSRIKKKVLKDITNTIDVLASEKTLIPVDSQTRVDKFPAQVISNFKGYKKYFYSSDSTYIYYEDVSIKKCHFTKTIYFDLSKNTIPISFGYSDGFCLPADSLKLIYSNVLSKKLGPSKGVTCAGDSVWYCEKNKNYIELHLNAFSGPSLNVIPANYRWLYTNDKSEVPQKTYEEFITFNKFPLLPDYPGYSESMSTNPYFTKSPLTLNGLSYNYNFFNLFKDDFDDYIRRNLDILSSKPNPARLQAIFDSIKLVTQKDLNLRDASLSLQKRTVNRKDVTSKISITVALYARPINRKEELTEVHKNINMLLAQGQIDYLSPLISQLFAEINSKDITNEGVIITSGNFNLTARKFSPIYGFWIFNITNKSCQ